MVREAESKGLEMLKAAQADDAVLTLKSYEAMAKVADGKATKIIIPNDLSKVASLAKVVSEVVKEDK